MPLFLYTGLSLQVRKSQNYFKLEIFTAAVMLDPLIF